MTVAEMHTAFKMGLDKGDTLSYPNFEPEEIDFWLNKSQDRFVKQRYGINNNKRQSFEETQKRTDDLRVLVRDLAVVPLSVGLKPNGFFVPLPPYTGLIDINGVAIANNADIYWFSVEEEIRARYKDCNGLDQIKRMPVKPIRHDEYAVSVLDPFVRPDITHVVRLLYQNRAEVITDGTFSIEM